ncbi:MAG: hypothetical protein EPO40_19480 [Myxococcaceae bacterium]|nr:MAG: hypothetical protein EPO40_19480 [Myxococcaceae bacterium]
MALSQEQRDALNTYVRERMKTLRCPLCGNNVFKGYGVLKIEVGDLEPSGVTWDATTMPFAAMVCTVCGNTLFIHLGKPGAGLTE